MGMLEGAEGLEWRLKLLESGLWRSAGRVMASDGQCQEIGGFLQGK